MGEWGSRRVDLNLRFTKDEANRLVRLLLIQKVNNLLAVVVAHHKAGGLFVNRPGLREARGVIAVGPCWTFGLSGNASAASCAPFGRLVDRGVHPSRVNMETQSRTTFEDALHSAALLRPKFSERWPCYRSHAYVARGRILSGCRISSGALSGRIYDP
jgi:hypothetical protein